VSFDLTPRQVPDIGLTSLICTAVILIIFCHNGTVPTAFTLTENVVTPKGVIIAHYKRTGEVFPTDTAQTLVDKYLKS